MKKNNNNQSNYFTQNIKQYGENFLKYKTPKDIEYDCIKIFRELAKGRIDIPKCGPYFLDAQFLESCLHGAIQKYNYHNVSFNGINCMVTMNQNLLNDNTTMGILSDHKKSVTAYNLIITILNNIKLTGDFTYLFTLVNQLQPFKYNI